MTEPLHWDDPTRTVTLPDGRVIRNLTVEEYNATYAEGTTHGVPADVLAEAMAKLEGPE